MERTMLLTRVMLTHLESAKFASKACELMLADRVWKWPDGHRIRDSTFSTDAVITVAREIRGVPDGRRVAPATGRLRGIFAVI